MTGASGAGSLAGSPLPKWQLALVVGAPVALGLGYMYYKNSSKPSPKPSRGKSKAGTKENGTRSDKQISIDGECNAKSVPAPEPETPLGIAQKFKDAGNSHFKIGKYYEAIAQYNNAIDACPKDSPEVLAIFYQNRAAAYEQLKKYSSVKADCTKALELNPKYSKALLRRARALEHCNELQPALEDATAACMLEGFTNQTALQMADRVLKQLGIQHATEYMVNKKFVMPSKHFIQKYISAFHKDPIFTTLQNKVDSDMPKSVVKVFDALREQKYDDVIPLCTEVLDSSASDAQSYEMEMLLLKATFHLLLGEHDTAINDFGTIIASDTASKEVKVNALIKRATLYMQVESPEKGLCDFEKAVEIDPNCGDIYHHRGQVNLLMEKLDAAKEDFEKAVELNPDFGMAYAQKCFINYRYAITHRDVQTVLDAINSFTEALRIYPDCPECYILYAQVLTEAKQYDKADAFYATAIEKDPHQATAYVHRGLLQLQWNGNVDKAVEYISQALKLDDKCEFGYEVLGTIEVQRGNLKEAIELFDKALELARTLMELTNIFSLRDAAKTQLTVRDRFGANVPWSLQSVP